MSKWEIVCPDGRKRHWPYGNKGDALHDAGAYSDGRATCGSNRAPEDGGRCPGGTHWVNALNDWGSA